MAQGGPSPHVRGPRPEFQVLADETPNVPRACGELCLEMTMLQYSVRE
jgi:hypothetical protein